MTICDVIIEFVCGLQGGGGNTTFAPGGKHPRAATGHLMYIYLRNCGIKVKIMHLLMSSLALRYLITLVNRLFFFDFCFQNMSKWVS